MKPLIFVPPAQAEALYDTQGDARDDFQPDDQAVRLPWRDDESADDMLSHSPLPAAGNEAFIRHLQAV